jgi:hypothetical protein
LAARAVHQLLRAGGSLTATGILAVTGLAVAGALQVIDTPSLPVTVVPAINLAAIIMGGISMGILINRVKQLERRMEKVQSAVFREDEPWDGGERRSRPPRGYDRR